MSMITTEEIWQPVVGYEILYEVSSIGRVYHRKHFRFLKPARHGKSRYLIVTLSRDGVESYHNLHQLMLAAFVGPCPVGQQARHLDDDPLNNILTNLCYGTQSQNRVDSIKLNNNAYHAATMTADQVIEMRAKHSKGQTMKSLAKEYHIHYGTARAICHKTSWKHL